MCVCVCVCGGGGGGGGGGVRACVHADITYMLKDLLGVWWTVEGKYCHKTANLW